MAEKHTTEYSIQYEEGSKGKHPHLDCIFRFKSKQAKADIVKKIKEVYTNNIEFHMGKIADWQYRLGYNLKETLYHEDYTLSTFSEAEKNEAIDYYLEKKANQEQAKAERERFQYIKANNLLYTLNQYLLKDKISIYSVQDYWTHIHVLEKQGYYFDISHNKHMDFCRWLIQYFTGTNRSHREIKIITHETVESKVMTSDKQLKYDDLLAGRACMLPDSDEDEENLSIKSI